MANLKENSETFSVLRAITPAIGLGLWPSFFESMKRAEEWETKKVRGAKRHLKKSILLQKNHITLNQKERHTQKREEETTAPTRQRAGTIWEKKGEKEEKNIGHNFFFLLALQRIDYLYACGK
nr:hypothetical protein [Pandoravirus aubagnensis]